MTAHSPYPPRCSRHRRRRGRRSPGEQGPRPQSAKPRGHRVSWAGYPGRHADASGADRAGEGARSLLGQKHTIKPGGGGGRFAPRMEGERRGGGDSKMEAGQGLDDIRYSIILRTMYVYVRPYIVIARASKFPTCNSYFVHKMTNEKNTQQFALPAAIATCIVFW